MERSGGSLRTRSQAAPDWTLHESVTLVNEMKATQIECGNSLASFQKWQSTVHNCNSLGVNRSLNQCKRRWESMLEQYNKVKPWESAYWDSFDEERKRELELPEQFDFELFNAIARYLSLEGEDGGGAETDPDTDPEAQQVQGNNAFLEIGPKRQRRRTKTKRYKIEERLNPWRRILNENQGVVSVPGFAYSGQMGSVSSPEGQGQTAGNNQVYGTSRSSDPVAMGSQAVTSPYRQASGPMGYYALQEENVFPERPGQPECQFYMKTGDCKFGAVCRFHHPRERLIPPPDCLLSPIGLPLRPGEPLCIFYSRYGICKFGPSCKFDHPMTVFTYSIAASSATDAPTVQRLLGSSSGTSALNMTSEGLVEAVSTKPRRLSLSETRKMPSGDNNIDREG